MVVDTNRLDAMKRKFLQLGFDDERATASATAELTWDSPILAGETLLFLCWDLINSWNQPGALRDIPAAHRIAQAGGKIEDMRLLTRSVTFSALFSFLYLLSEGPNYKLREILKVWEPGYPGWALIERDTDRSPTGRTIVGLYEALRISDPSGQEGRDFLDE
jgi:hypothetical protein